MEKWYLIQVKAHAHQVAQRNLARQGFETFMPMQESLVRRASRFYNHLQPLFPGYMFVRFHSDISPWRKINNTMGVTRLLSVNGQPRALPLKLISGLKLRCDASGKMLPPEELVKGDQVELLKGPFAHFVATVETIDVNQRIWILMDFMGQETRIRVLPEYLNRLSK